MFSLKFFLLSVFGVTLLVTLANSHTTQRPHSNSQPPKEDDGNPFFDMASAFIQESLTNQNGGGGAGGGIGGIASMIGSLMQPDGGKSGGGSPAGAILSGIGSLLAANAGGNGGENGGGGGGGFDPSMMINMISMFTGNSGNDEKREGGGGGGGFDPSIIGNVISMFAGNSGGNDQKRGGGGGGGLETILSLASTFLSNQNSPSGSSQNEGRGAASNQGQGEGLMSLLPMVMQAINTFSGPEGLKTQQKHKEHAWVLPPFLEQIHVMWDHFSQSELAAVLWQQSGVHKIFKV